MKRGRTVSAIVVAVTAASIEALAGPPANEFQLLTGFAAQEACSCAYVVGQSDAYCSAYGQQPGFTVTITFDHAAQTATASFSVSKRTATYTAGQGCVLGAL